MLELVKRCVDAHLEERGRGETRGDRMLCFDVSNRKIDGWCYLFFPPTGPAPLVVAKAARTPAGRAVFEIEHRNLEQLTGRGINTGIPRVPSPLGRFELGDVLITLQSALDGALLKNVAGGQLFSPANVDRTLSAVFDWWSHFQTCFGVQRVRITDEIHERQVREPVQRFCGRYRLEADETEFLSRRFESERALSGIELPLLARHGDFCAANMVLGREGLAVFDWEFPLRPETPLFDLFFFFSSVRFPFTGRRGESSHLESFVQVFWGESYFAERMRARLAGVVETFAIPRDAVEDLFVLSLIQVANMKYDGLIASHGLADEAHRDDDDQRKLARWDGFERPDKDAPFACIRRGVLENLRVVVRRGMPRLLG